MNMYVCIHTQVNFIGIAVVATAALFQTCYRSPLAALSSSLYYDILHCTCFFVVVVVVHF